jgi:hypothetical protein
LTITCNQIKCIIGGVLPRDFVTENEYGIRGGVEKGFMSTTTNPMVGKKKTEPSPSHTNPTFI